MLLTLLAGNALLLWRCAAELQQYSNAREWIYQQKSLDSAPVHPIYSIPASTLSSPAAKQTIKRKLEIRTAGVESTKVYESNSTIPGSRPTKYFKISVLQSDATSLETPTGTTLPQASSTSGAFDAVAMGKSIGIKSPEPSRDATPTSQEAGVTIDSLNVKETTDGAGEFSTATSTVAHSMSTPGINDPLFNLNVVGTASVMGFIKLLAETKVADSSGIVFFTPSPQTNVNPALYNRPVTVSFGPQIVNSNEPASVTDVPSAAAPAKTYAPALIVSVPRNLLPTITPSAALLDQAEGQPQSVKLAETGMNSLEGGLAVSVLGPGGSTIVVGTQTLVSGQGATVDGIPVSGLSGALVVGSRTIVLPTALLPANNALPTATSGVAGIAATATTAGAGVVSVNIKGTASAAASASMALTGAPVPLATVAGKIVTTDSSGLVRIDGSTLSVNGPEVTISGTPISLASQSVLIVESIQSSPSGPVSGSGSGSVSASTSRVEVTLSSVQIPGQRGSTTAGSSAASTATQKHGGASSFKADGLLLATVWLLSGGSLVLGILSYILV